MKRIIDYYLHEWRLSSAHKPLLLRGARQVGKTHAARELGASFKTFIEVNLEIDESARRIFEKELDPKRILFQLAELLQVTIVPGETLLFIDEIQQAPKAITALRYFYERMPELHVIAAGSLVDFAIEHVGIPVGRVSSLYMRPLSFLEFLVARGDVGWARSMLQHDPTKPASDPFHEQLINVVGEYVAVGGMPEAVGRWIKERNSRPVKVVHADLLFNYQQDFGRYAKSHQIKYLDRLFQKAIEQLSRKFMFSRVGEYKKRELEPAFELLEKAGLVYKVTQTAAQGVPLGAQADLDKFKVIFMDVGLCQALLNFDLSSWLLTSEREFVNKGEIIEAFVGQELLAYSDPAWAAELFYWHREHRSSSAEVDYVVQLKDHIVPVEVKSGTSRRTKSMQIFLETHAKSSYGLRFSALNYEQSASVYSYPFYAISKLFYCGDELMAQAMNWLVQNPRS